MKTPLETTAAIWERSHCLYGVANSCTMKVPIVLTTVAGGDEGAGGGAAGRAICAASATGALIASIVTPREVESWSSGVFSNVVLTSSASAESKPSLDVGSTIVASMATEPALIVSATSTAFGNNLRRLARKAAASKVSTSPSAVKVTRMSER